MRFIKVPHFTVHGHAFTLRNGRLMLRRLADEHLGYDDEDDDEEKKAKGAWKQRLRDIDHRIEHLEPDEAISVFQDLYDDESLPDKISKELEPLLRELKKTRPEIQAHIFLQVDEGCPIEFVEDGHERAAPNPDAPTCTVVFRSHLWRHVQGTAEQVVGSLLDAPDLSRSNVEKNITGALKSSIDAHGPITTESSSSAAKRVVGALKHLGIRLE